MQTPRMVTIENSNGRFVGHVFGVTSVKYEGGCAFFYSADRILAGIALELGYTHNFRQSEPEVLPTMEDFYPAQVTA